MPRQKKSKYYVRPDGLHEKIVVINGKRIYFRGKTDGEVDRKMVEYQEKIVRGRLFENIADDWKEDHYKEITENTKRNYEARFKSAKEEFRGQYASEITPQEIKAFLSEMARKKSATKTISAQKLVLNLIFDYGITCGDLKINPCTAVKVPRGVPKQERRIPTAEEIEIVKSSVNCTFGLFHLFLLCTGCRKGEALAVQFKDIDIDSGIIHITKSVYYSGSSPHIKQPKTVSGVRDVVVLDILKRFLPEGKPDEYIFSGIKLNYKTTVDRWIKRWKQETGLTLTPHELRHGFATICYDAGLDPKAAQHLLGHSSIAMTQNIYTHISEARKEDTRDKLNAYMDTQKIHSTASDTLELKE